MTAFDHLLSSLQDIINCDNTPPPASPLGKRAAPDDETDDAEAEDNNSNRSPSVQPANENLLLHAHKYIARKKLKTEAAKEVEKLMTDPHALKLFEIYTLGLELMASFSSICAAAPEFWVSEDLQTLLKTLHLGLPDNIKQIPADWAKFEKEVFHELTQARSIIKKEIKKSLKGNPTGHVDIFQLTQALASKGSITMTIPLCARVALMRLVYEEDPSPTYWVTLDEHLASLRKKTGGDKMKLAHYVALHSLAQNVSEGMIRVFKSVLDNDRGAHGNNADAISLVSEDKVVDERQQQVDEAFLVSSDNGGVVCSGTQAGPSSGQDSTAEST
ncbi:hypothetical protein BC835DRAFT_1456620 [Cytidiella melzeri]|nr:hypothetical protein BC835DRAFT_1456620 [Cytidiella melzeri]